MPKNKKTPVSKAETPEEIGEYWDTQSLDASDSVREVQFEVRARRKRRVTLDPDLYERVESEAKMRGISPETLANRWLTEKVMTESALK
jgi:hypothetical protein